jgi:hypothetical protein
MAADEGPCPIINLGKNSVINPLTTQIPGRKGMLLFALCALKIIEGVNLKAKISA